MKRFSFILSLLVLLINCGEPDSRGTPIVGRFNVQTNQVFNQNTSEMACNNLSYTEQFYDSIWIIEKLGNTYRILIEEYDGYQILYAVSNDGLYFYGNSVIDAGICPLNISSSVEMWYRETSFYAKIFDDLSLTCQTGTCSNYSEVRGYLEYVIE